MLTCRRDKNPFLGVKIEVSEKLQKISGHRALSAPSQVVRYPPLGGVHKSWVTHLVVLGYYVGVSFFEWQVELNEVLISRILLFKLGERRLELRIYS